MYIETPGKRLACASQKNTNTKEERTVSSVVFVFMRKESEFVCAIPEQTMNAFVVRATI